jgi:hypothetical protein
MFVIHLPRTFRVGDTADCRINAKPARVTWREIDTPVIEPGDARTILSRDREDDLVTFHGADDNGTYKHSVEIHAGIEGHTWVGPDGPYHIAKPFSETE